MELLEAILKEAGITFAGLLMGVGYLSRRLTRIETAIFGEKNEPTLMQRIRQIELAIARIKPQAVTHEPIA